MLNGLMWLLEIRAKSSLLSPVAPGKFFIGLVIDFSLVCMAVCYVRIVQTCLVWCSVTDRVAVSLLLQPRDKSGTSILTWCVTSTVNFILSVLCRVSQEEWTKLRKSVPYVELYRYKPKHLYPNLNGYGDNGQRSLKL